MSEIKKKKQSLSVHLRQARREMALIAHPINGCSVSEDLPNKVEGIMELERPPTPPELNMDNMTQSTPVKSRRATLNLTQPPTSGWPKTISSSLEPQTMLKLISTSVEPFKAAVMSSQPIKRPTGMDMTIPPTKPGMEPSTTTTLKSPDTNKLVGDGDLITSKGEIKKKKKSLSVQLREARREMALIAHPNNGCNISEEFPNKVEGIMELERPPTPPELNMDNMSQSTPVKSRQVTLNLTQPPTSGWPKTISSSLEPQTMLKLTSTSVEPFKLAAVVTSQPIKRPTGMDMTIPPTKPGMEPSTSTTLKSPDTNKLVGKEKRKKKKSLRRAIRRNQLRRARREMALIAKPNNSGSISEDLPYKVEGIMGLERPPTPPELNMDNMTQSTPVKSRRATLNLTQPPTSGWPKTISSSLEPQKMLKLTSTSVEPFKLAAVVTSQPIKRPTGMDMTIPPTKPGLEPSTSTTLKSPDSNKLVGEEKRKKKKSLRQAIRRNQLRQARREMALIAKPNNSGSISEELPRKVVNILEIKRPPTSPEVNVNKMIQPQGMLTMTSTSLEYFPVEVLTSQTIKPPTRMAMTIPPTKPRLESMVTSTSNSPDTNELTDDGSLITLSIDSDWLF